MTKRAIEKVLQWAAKKFPASKVTADNIEAYAEELEAMDHTRLELVFKVLISKSEFWPSIKLIQDTERTLVVGDSDAKAFRTLELALIQLNDERKGGVITHEQYIARYRTVLEASGFTQEQLEQATVYKPDKGGHASEAALTWDQLRYRRRARTGASQDEGT